MNFLLGLVLVIILYAGAGGFNSRHRRLRRRLPV